VTGIVSKLETLEMAIISSGKFREYARKLRHNTVTLSGLIRTRSEARKANFVPSLYAI
jgi:hypothetical protein